MFIVTGAAGFIGSNVVTELEAAESGPIVVVDWRQTAEKWRNLADHKIAAFVDSEQVLELLDGNASAIKVIIHMGRFQQLRSEMSFA